MSSWRLTAISPQRLQEEFVRQGYLQKKQKRSFPRRYQRRYWVLLAGDDASAKPPLLVYFGSAANATDFKGAFDLKYLEDVDVDGADLSLVFRHQQAGAHSKRDLEALRLRASDAAEAGSWREAITSAVPSRTRKQSAHLTFAARKQSLMRPERSASTTASQRRSEADAGSGSGTATSDRSGKADAQDWTVVADASGHGRIVLSATRTASSTDTGAEVAAASHKPFGGDGSGPASSSPSSSSQLPAFAADVSALQQFLQTHGISTIRYGRGKAKSLAHLLAEITGGETVLREVNDGADLERVVHVAEARVYRPEAPGRYLLETHQLFDGGRVRFRNVLLSEKFKPGEDAIAAAVRGVREELCGLDARKAVDEPAGGKQIVPQRHTLKPPREVVLESPSYPGLRSRYFIHRVDVEVSPLDSASFMTNEYRGDGSIKQQHFWKWHREAEIEGILGVNERQRERGQGRATAAPWLQALSPSQDSWADSMEQDSLFDLSPDEVDAAGGPRHISYKALKKALRHWGLEQEEQQQLLAACTAPEGATAAATAVTAAALRPHFPIVRTAPPLILSTDDQLLVKSLFKHATLVSVSLLHGGFSGSYVLQAQASTGTVDSVSAAEASSVLKIDDVVEIADERDRMRRICPLLGENTVKVIGHAEVGNRAAIKMDLAGGSWLLPELAGVTSASLVCTLADSWHEHLQLIKGEEDKQQDSGSDASWQGESGAKMTSTRRAFGDPATIVREIFLVIMSTPTVTERRLERLNLYVHYDIESRVERHVIHIEDGAAGELESLSPGVRAYFEHFVERMQTEQLCGDDLSEHLVGLVHGDLNARNVLVDSGDVVWIVDFAFSGERHVLTDIAKLECSLLYEYGLAASLQEPAGPEWDMALGIAQALAQDTLLPTKPAGLSAHWEALFVTLDTLRHCVVEMLSGAPTKIASAAVLEYSFPLLRNALHALKFAGFSRGQRALALAVARLHATRIEASLDPTTSRVCWPQDLLTAYLQPQLLTAEADDERELNRYCHCLQIHHGHMIDAISREPLNIMEQCVSLKVLQGEDKADCIHKAEEVDAAMERHMAARRLNEPYYLLRGHAGEATPGRGRGRRGGGGVNDTEAEDDASQIDALKRLLPGADSSEYRQVVLLGAAASGKSVLLKKTLVVLAQSARGASGFVPILILLIDLGRMMVQHGLGPTDLLVERYLEETWGPRSPRCATLCRAFRARRTLLLLDGLDEAGTQKDAVEQYIRRLVRDGHRVVVSSRHTGFKDEVFSGFDFIQVCPLSRAMQHEVVERRLAKHSNAVIEGVKAELRRPQYTEMAQNPLMLSLLVNVLGHRVMAADAVEQQQQYQQQPITRAQLYAAAIKLVLHKTADDKHKTAALRHEHDLDSHEQLSALATPACMTLLETLAFATHRRGKRDITSRELVDSVDGAASSAAAAAPKTSAMTDADRLHAEQAWQESLAESCNVLQHFSRQGQLPLFVVLEEKYGAKAVSSARSGRGSITRGPSTFDQVMRFSHLTFQEFLAARHIAAKLQRAVMAAGLEEDAQRKAIRVALSELVSGAAGTSKDTQQRVPTHDMLLDPWWKQTLLFVGGTLMEQAWEPLAMVLLHEDDASGALSVLLQQMLAENSKVAAALDPGDGAGERGSARDSMDLGDASGRVRPSGVLRALQMVRERISDLRPMRLLCAGLCHPSSQLRNLAISELVEFNVPRLNVAEALVRRLGFQPHDQEATQEERTLSWFEYRNAVVSIGMLEQASSVITSALVQLWRSSGDRRFGRLLAPDGGNLGPATAHLRNSAVQALGALGTWNEPDVRESLRAACGLDPDPSNIQVGTGSGQGGGRGGVGDAELARALYDARVLCTSDSSVLNLCANMLQQDNRSKLSSRAFLLLCDATASLSEHAGSFCGAMVDPWFIQCLATALPPPPIPGSSENQASAARVALMQAEAKYNAEERECAAAAVRGLSQALCTSSTSAASRKQIISAVLPVFNLREDQGLGLLAALLSVLRGRISCSMDSDRSQPSAETVARVATEEALRTLGPPFDALCNVNSGAGGDDIDNAACSVLDSLLQEQAQQLEQEGARARTQQEGARAGARYDDGQNARPTLDTPRTPDSTTLPASQVQGGVEPAPDLSLPVGVDSDTPLESVSGAAASHPQVTLEDALDEAELPPLSVVPAAEQIKKLLRQQRAAVDTAHSKQEDEPMMRRRLNKLAHVRTQLAPAAKLSTLLLPATATEIRVAAACRLALHCDEITIHLLKMMPLSASRAAPGIGTDNLVTSMACEVDKFVLGPVLQALERCNFQRDDTLIGWLIKSLLPLSKIHQCNVKRFVPSESILDPSQPAECLRNALRRVASVSVDSDVFDANSFLRRVARVTASISLVEVDAFTECARIVELGGQDSAYQRRMGQALYEELVSDELELQPAADPALLIHTLTPHPMLLGPRQKDASAGGALEHLTASFAFAPLLRWVRARREAEPRWSLRTSHPALFKRLRQFVRTNPNMSVGALHLLKELCVGRFEIELDHYDDDIEPAEREPNRAEVHPLNNQLFGALVDKDINAVRDVIDRCDGNFDTALFVDDENNQPLHVAARLGFVAAIDLILKLKRGQLEATGFDDYHPLHFAAEYNKGDAVQRLIDYGAGVDSRNSYGNTPLHFAARGGFENIVSLLLDSGADPRITNSGGKTALSLARQRVHSGQKNDGSSSVALLVRALSKVTLNCPGKHGLKACLWDSDHSTQQCDSCNRIVETSQSMFRCQTCDYDLCNTCYSRHAAELASQKECMTCPVCQDQDLLAFTPASQKWESMFYCNACGQPQDAEAELHGCRKCNFDLCRDCYDAEKTDFAPIDRLPALLRNDEGRDVRLGRNVDYSDRFYCNTRQRELEADPECNGVCGPLSGPQCASCARFQSENRRLVMQLNVRFEDADGSRVAMLLNDQLGVDCYKELRTAWSLHKSGIEDSVYIREGMLFMPDEELLLDADIPDRAGQCTMRRLLALFHSANPNKELDRRMLKDPATQKKLDEDLFTAVYAGRRVDVERLLDDGADPSAHKDMATGKRALHLCTDAAMTRLLLGRGNTTLLDAQDGDGMTALHVACRNGRTDIVEALLEKGADVTAVSDGDQTPLHWAASSGSVEALQALLGTGVPASLVDASGRTPLKIAQDTGKQEAVKLLQGAQSMPQAEALSFLSRTTQALHKCEQPAFADLAALEAPPEPVLRAMQLVGILLGYRTGAVGGASDTWQHLPAGFWSVAQQWLHDRHKMVHDIDAFNPISVSNRARDNAENVLQLCAPAPGVETKVLKAEEALTKWATAAALSATVVHQQRETNRRRKLPAELQRGLNARLHESAAKGDVPQVSSLLVQGVSPEWINPDEFGQRALHRAAYNGHVAVVQVLLAQGVDAESVNSNGVRALHMAASRGHDGVVRLLLDHGVDARALSRRNRTAIDLARQHGHASTEELLQNNMQQNQKERVARHKLAAHLTKALIRKREDKESKDQHAPTEHKLATEREERK